MAENKTKPTEADVDGYFAGIADEARREDCKALSKIMTKATKEPPRMWGTSIVGFGSYHYKYESGREGESCVVGFSSRKGDISLYLVAEFPGREELLAKLGSYKSGKGCLYIRRLGDIDEKTLEKVIAASAAARLRNHGA